MLKSFTPKPNTTAFDIQPQPLGAMDRDPATLGLSFPTCTMGEMMWLIIEQFHPYKPLLEG